ncbi:MAG: DEAD/DEAH box helicase [Candidatus Sericytochromatia bacterium]|nr:DEAD/DEAH box helicase [Candidatus Sericytochromatia bacterium]
MLVKFTPAKTLVWIAQEDVPAVPKRLKKAFQANWCEGIFLLAADKISTEAFPDLRFWQSVGNHVLTALCHLNQIQDPLSEPTPEQYTHWVLSAPPFPGAEYLSAESLQYVWQALSAWLKTALQGFDTIDDFLTQKAPQWHHVGRICFHLAENKSHAAFPFAFMATYISGFGQSGEFKHLPLKKALEQYAGVHNKAALIKLLGPIHTAQKSIAWVKDLVKSHQIYQPMLWTPEQAYQFLKDIPALEASGLIVKVPNWWKKRSTPKVKVTLGSQNKTVLGLNTMLDFSVDVALGEQVLTPEEIQTLLQHDGQFIAFKGQWIELDRQQLQQVMSHWQAIEKQLEDQGISFIEGMRLLAGAAPDLTSDAESERESQWLHISAGQALQETLKRLQHPDSRSGTGPKALKATLRTYQQNGLNWLYLLTELGLGACLADDMGLGKTLQILALLLLLKEQGTSAPSLLIVPASLLGNWKNEAHRFAPSLRLLFLHPAETERKTLTEIESDPPAYLQSVDLVVTTYALALRQNWLADCNWQLLILDEAQAIKNPGAKQSRAVKQLPARTRIALTGTPIENRLEDLWSLFDFINPGLLGSARLFKDFVKKLQQREQETYAPLRKLVNPYILRRLKTDHSIAPELPEKTEVNSYCYLSKAQVSWYQKSVKSLEKALRESPDAKTRRGLVLQYILRFKQICNHPSQFSGDGDWEHQHSGKFLRLEEICSELAERQEKVLIFTQFREIIPHLHDFLTPIFGATGLMLHGGTPVKQREQLVKQFQSPNGPAFFILSIKAGGTGLNLTNASQVIHFDRWWNPAVENQATDRAFRIGQQKNVLVHKFITRGTIEERIDEMIFEKQALASDILTGEEEVKLTNLSDEALLDIIRLDISQLK